MHCAGSQSVEPSHTAIQWARIAIQWLSTATGVSLPQGALNGCATTICQCARAALADMQQCRAGKWKEQFCSTSPARSTEGSQCDLLSQPLSARLNTAHLHLQASFILQGHVRGMLLSQTGCNTFTDLALAAGLSLLGPLAITPTSCAAVWCWLASRALSIESTLSCSNLSSVAQPTEGSLSP